MFHNLQHSYMLVTVASFAVLRLLALDLSNAVLALQKSIASRPDMEFVGMCRSTLWAGAVCLGC